MQRIKCTVIGDYHVGKTSVIYSYINKSLEDVQTTLGIDFFNRLIFTRFGPRHYCLRHV